MLFAKEIEEHVDNPRHFKITLKFLTVLPPVASAEGQDQTLWSRSQLPPNCFPSFSKSHEGSCVDRRPA